MSEKICPSCGKRRPASELFCQTPDCGWNLTNVPLALAETGWPSSTQSSAVGRCPNGHEVRPGDLICSRCGELVEADGQAAGFGEGEQAPFDTGPPSDDTPRAYEPPEVNRNADRIGAWQCVSRLEAADRATETWIVSPTDGCAASPSEIASARHILTLYPETVAFDADARGTAHGLPRHVMPPVDHGDNSGRRYEVVAFPDGACLLAQATPGTLEPSELRALLGGMCDALEALGRANLRHRDLCPEAIVVMDHEVSGVSVIRFGSALLSSHDLDTAAPPEPSRYTAPEALAGAVTPAADWWSLGIILLELATGGACFEGISDQAFLMQVVSGAVEIPDDIDEDVSTVIRGLLAKDRGERWQAREVRAWLAGEPAALPKSAPGSAPSERDDGQTSAIDLASRVYRRSKAYALAAGLRENWDEARDQLTGGQLIHWLESLPQSDHLCASVRTVMRRDGLDDDIRLAIVLKALNPDMPLVVRGEIITPAWLLQNVEDAFKLISGSAPELLQRLNAEPLLTRLKRRNEDVQKRAETFEIELDEQSVKELALATSRKRLEDIWDQQRRLMPDSDHAGIAGLLGKSKLRDEDLILLLAAAKSQFTPLAEVVSETTKLARREGVRTFDEAAAQDLLQLPRREILDRLDDRIEDFARCGHDRIDTWVDQYRLEKRVSLSRAVVALSLPEDTWQKPAKQVYVSRLLEHFEKRIATSVSRGALARMTIGKTSPRLDLTELGTTRVSAQTLLEHLLDRSDRAIDIDPGAFEADARAEQRLRTLVRRVDLHRRETGIDGLYLGFPFVLMPAKTTSAKPRIAPVLLWPVTIRAEVGQRARFQIAFDRDREEVRLNPALRNMLAPDAYKKWEEARDNALAGITKPDAIIDEFQALVDKVRKQALSALPPADTKVPANAVELTSCAVMFHVTFVGQAIVEDIRALQRTPPAGTGLETLLRAREEHARPAEIGAETEAAIDRFATAESDPTQDRAVARARTGPGLVIEGPPGTGKSQTIVNLVADAIGRKMSLLIVCQKQAALDVVMKRLEREGLGDRIVMVTDPTKDRRAILEAIRNQLDNLRTGALDGQYLINERASLVVQIDLLESQLNGRHQALRNRDPASGRSYRAILADLIGLEAEGRRPDAVGLRPIMVDMSAAEVDAIADQCAAISAVWLPSSFEGSPLRVLKPFAADPGTAAAFSQALETLQAAERKRGEALEISGEIIQGADPAALGLWATQHGPTLLQLPPAECAEAGVYIRAFEVDSVAGSGSAGDRAISAIGGLIAEMSGLEVPRIDRQLSQLVSALGDLELDGWILVAADAVKPRSWLARLFGAGSGSRKKITGLLATVTPAVDGAAIQLFIEAAEHEQRVRGLLDLLASAITSAGGNGNAVRAPTLYALRGHAANTLASLKRVKDLHPIFASAPCKPEALAAASRGTPAAFADLFNDITRTMTLSTARRRSREALEQLAIWFELDWMANRRDDLDSDREIAGRINPIVSALPTLADFQRFRTRAEHLPAEVMAVLTELRPLVPQLETLAPEQIGPAVGRIIRAESRIAWKQRIEAREPMLTADATEIETLVKALADAEQRLADLNKRVLRSNIDRARLGNREDWEAITRYQGPRARRLREVMQLGSEIGLMELRPVWLMSPDVASRLLPLANGLFDTIVYDEASQMPVEYALPSLFRARTIIVSGDEKQLPPTSFFSSRESEDDEGEFGDLDEDLSQEERDAAIESWNRREIQDCPNLLDLAKSELPSVQLQVHYRSRFRELIAFSNHAYYGNGLQVPVRHPEAEIDAHKPLEVIHVGGTYENRTNADEVCRIVAYLERIWLEDPAPPTIGVVTFNRDQADLIEEKLEERAEQSDDFRRAYLRELRRVVAGEDVGFFVKNVENVQGDERDAILFSTTFGHNAHGQFRRNFGVLGQSGGERRLNVAITRAKERVTIFTSMPVDEIADVLGSGRAPTQPREYLQLYLAFADALSRGDHDGAGRLLAQFDAPPHFEHQNASDEAGLDAFQCSVQRAISELGLEPVSASDGTAFGLDLAIRDPERGGFAIGIECDTADHPLLARAHAREVWRRQLLERSIPVIHRIPARSWYQDRDGERVRLFNAIRSAISSPEFEARQHELATSRPW